MNDIVCYILSIFLGVGLIIYGWITFPFRLIIEAHKSAAPKRLIL